MEDEVTLINKVLSNKEFQAQGKINEGSYGEIFKVRKKEGNQLFAMKALEKSKLQKLRKMHEVVIEVLVLGKLNHPGIIRMYEVIEREDYYGLVMELCPFSDLFNLIKAINKSIELLKKKKRIMVYYLAQILEAISYLHSFPLIHRDLKPENIVIAEDLRVRIIDFGTTKINSPDFLSREEQDRIAEARSTDEASSPRKSLVGSANYLSPEALRLQYSEKSDIWAFGVIAYKFYFTSLPFEGSNNMEIFKKIVENEVVFEEDMDVEFKELLTLCLRKDKNLRPDAKTLKKCAIFKEISFETIFKIDPPIDRKQLSRQNDKSETSSSKQFLFQCPLQKKMFFGNFKPRLLTISRMNTRLTMAYRYLPSKEIKNEFQLNLNDFAEELKNNQFQVVTGDKRYCFRCGKGQVVGEVVERINNLIKQEYHL